MPSRIDLHELDALQAVERFVRHYNRQLEAGGGAIEVIHGHGSSGGEARIRRHLRRLLRQHADRLDWLPGEALDGNPGVTLVDPRRPLPEPEDALAEAILAWCERPRSLDKIVGRFRRHGQPAVRAALDRLERSGRLERGWKGPHRVYRRAKAEG